MPVTASPAFATRNADVPVVVPGGYDRVASTLALQPLPHEFGVDLEQVPAESGWPADLFSHPDNLIPFRQGSRLLGMCIDRTGCAHLGPLIGRQTTSEAPAAMSEGGSRAASGQAHCERMRSVMSTPAGAGTFGAGIASALPGGAGPTASNWAATSGVMKRDSVA